MNGWLILGLAGFVVWLFFRRHASSPKVYLPQPGKEQEPSDEWGKAAAVGIEQAKSDFAAHAKPTTETDQLVEDAKERKRAINAVVAELRLDQAVALIWENVHLGNLNSPDSWVKKSGVLRVTHEEIETGSERASRRYVETSYGNFAIEAINHASHGYQSDDASVSQTVNVLMGEEIVISVKRYGTSDEYGTMYHGKIDIRRAVLRRDWISTLSALRERLEAESCLYEKARSLEEGRSKAMDTLESFVDKR